MDIHNYKGRLERTIERIKNSDISEENKQKKIDKKLLVAHFLLLASFLLVFWFSWNYLKQNTHFLEQANELLFEKEQLISKNSLWALSIGIILFGVSCFFLKDTVKVALFFLWELLLLMASALFIVGLFVPYLKFNFKIGLMLSAFIIYYSIYRAKKFWLEKN